MSSRSRVRSEKRASKIEVENRLVALLADDPETADRLFEIFRDTRFRAHSGGVIPIADLLDRVRIRVRPGKRS